MHPFDFPPLPLEGGIAPLKRLYEITPLCPEAPRAQGFLLLLAAVCDHALAQKSAALAGVSGDARQQLLLLQRIDMSLSSQLHSLVKTENIPERAMLYADLLLEGGAAFAMRLSDGPMRRALHFTLPEFLDELYRLSNLSLLLGGRSGRDLLNGTVEIMPGRPLISCHRHPYDDSAAPLDAADETALSALHTLSALLEAQRSFCLHALPGLTDSDARALLAEIACVSQGHAARFLCLTPPMPPLRRALSAQYAGAYLFYSRCETEEDAGLRDFLEPLRDHACNQLRKLCELAGAETLPAFPPPLGLGQSKGYVRDTLEYLGETAKRTDYVPVGSLAPGADFFRYQKRVCGDGNAVPSHLSVQRMIRKTGRDDRFEIAPHPVEALRSRTRDNTWIAR